MADAILISGIQAPIIPEGWTATELSAERHLLVRTELPVQPRVFRGTFKTVVVLGEPCIHERTDQMLCSDAFPGITSGELQEWSEGYTGHFAVIAIHHDSGSMVYVTDLMESIPVYCTEAGGGIVVGTHIDAVAQVSGYEAVDRASLLDFIVSGTIAPPATWYQCVAVASAAAVALASPRAGWQEQLYWTPDEPDSASLSLNEAAEALEPIMDENVRLALRGRDRAAALVSGGEDSRVIAGLAKRHREQLDGLIFLERMNREGRLARSAMKALGCPLRLYERDHDYYLRYLSERRALVGSGMDVRHTHAFNIMPAGEWDVVLGGLFADTLLKAEKARYEPARYRWRGVQISKSRLSPEQGFGWPRSVDRELLEPSLLEEVEERRRCLFEALQRYRPYSAYGWRTVWPAGACAVAVPHFAACRRMVNMQEPFAYNTTVAFAAGLPDTMKLDGELYRRAFMRAMGLSGWVPRITGRVPRLGFYPNIACSFGFSLWAKAVDSLRGQDGAWEGPWPSFSHIMNHVLDLSSLLPDRGESNQTVLGLFEGERSLDALMSDPRLDRFSKHRLLQVLKK